ncbi:MAG: hypothetical protein HQM06_06245 [Magnetococcales bacterium]|nr:hypothetical protein [Magnetococcales bacterium]
MTDSSPLVAGGLSVFRYIHNADCCVSLAQGVDCDDQKMLIVEDIRFCQVNGRCAEQIMAFFPEKFTPDRMAGVRGKQFDDRSDFFQQLVGDACTEFFGIAAAHVSKTSGRDGLDHRLVQSSQGSREDPKFSASSQLDARPDNQERAPGGRNDDQGLLSYGHIVVVWQ